jgi:hypothetical protein
MSEPNPQPAAAAAPESPCTAPPVRHNSTEFDTFFDPPPPTPPESSPPTPAASPLTPRQQTAISLLTAGQTCSSTASILGVHRSTLHNWKHDPAFAAELARRQDELTRAADARLRLLLLQSTHHALDSLHADDPEDRWRNAFRLLTILRPYRTALNTPGPAPATPEDAQPGQTTGA